MRRPLRHPSIALVIAASSVLGAIGGTSATTAQAEVVVTTNQAKIVDTASTQTTTAIGPQAFERLPGPKSIAELLLTIPGQVGDSSVTGVTIHGNSLSGATATYLTPGWNSEMNGNGIGLTGPPTAGGVQAKFSLPKAKTPVNFIDLKLYGGKKELQKSQLPTFKLNPGMPIIDPKGAIQLPPVIYPGQKIQFTPRDPKYTPGGGTWKIGDTLPRWNEMVPRPTYEFELPWSYPPKKPLKVSYVSPWNEKLVDGVLTDVVVRRGPTNSSGPAEVTGCSPATLATDSFCICGNFPDGAEKELAVNGHPIDDYIVARSDSILSLAFPASFPAGPLDVAAVPPSRIEVRDGKGGTLLRVAGEIDRSKLLRGESTSLRLKVSGSERAIPLELWNDTPGIVTLEGGVKQLVQTSGGAANLVERGVHAVTPGDFQILFKLTVDSCPCARSPVELLYDVADGEKPGEGDKEKVGEGEKEKVADGGSNGPGSPLAKPSDPFAPKGDGPSGGNNSGGTSTDTSANSGGTSPEGDKKITWPPNGGKYVLDDWKLGKDSWTFGYGFTQEKGTPQECRDTAKSCDELKKRAEEAEATAARLRAQAAWARENQPFLDREAQAIDEAAAKDEAQVDVLLRQAADNRALERSALERSGKAVERAGANPGKGYDAEALAAQADAAKYAGFAGGLELEAQDLARLAADKRAQAARMRNAAPEAEAAALEADRLAYLARAAYLDCLDEVRNHCGGTVPVFDTTAFGTGLVEEHPGGGSVGQPTAPAGGSSTAPTPDYCGPDVSAAYTAALRRVYQRMKSVPDSEKGPVDGAYFLRDNGVNIDEYPMWSGSWGCPTGLCLSNEKGQPCYRLYGHCVPRHVLNDIMFGFTAELLDVPEVIQNFAGNWAEGHFNPKAGQGAYEEDVGSVLSALWDHPDPEISRKSYRVGNSIAKDWKKGDMTTGPDLGAKIAEGFKGFLDEMLAEYPSLKSCVDCPNKKALKSWQRDWSRTSWRFQDGKALQWTTPHEAPNELEEIPEADETH